MYTPCGYNKFGTGICAFPRESLSFVIVRQGELAEFLINPMLHSQIKQPIKSKTKELQRRYV